jgi:NSS family neurotransmitter:Na+ symporter
MFNALDHLAANNLLLVGGALSSIFIGWLVPKALKLEEMDVPDGPMFALWRFLIRFVIPPVLVVVLAGVFLEL